MLVAAGVLPGIEPHRDDIGAQVKVGVSAATIHQRLVEEHGLSANVASVRRWVRANLPEDARRAAVTVLRDTPPPGEEARIDYGRLGMWTDPHTGRRRTVWAFVVDRPDQGQGTGRAADAVCARLVRPTTSTNSSTNEPATR